MKKLGTLSLAFVLLISLFACSVTFEGCNVEFIVDGDVYKTVSVEKGAVVTLPDEPAKDGYIFDGWYLDEAYTAVFIMTLPINSSTRLYAKWVKGNAAIPSDIAEQIITVEQALELCGEPGSITSERYYIYGKVVSVDNAEYGAMTVEDETGTISVYGSYSADGSVGYSKMEEVPYKGDEVLLYCLLQNYNGAKEVKSAWIISVFPNKEEFEESDYTEMTIETARVAAKGTKVKVSGTVAAITYANGMKPSGVMLVDGASSIYVYDSDLARRVKVGNTVTVAGEKEYWILKTEAANAASYGYKGCNQLAGVTLLANDERTDAVDLSALPASTVKEILDTPVTEDVTTQIYKVTARVTKSQGTGFVNYYFNDLDYIDAENPGTGSYAYTQCNGSDFAWLDAYDGKMCTVYLTALNAKSTTSDCYFRILPVAVEEIESFSFASADVAEHVVKYYGVGQFLDRYEGNPALALITSVSSALLGFENATLSYTSSDTSLISITEEDGKVVMNCLSDGLASIAVTASYAGNTYSESVDVIVRISAEVPSVGVLEAINAENDTTVTVKGIVGPSLINQKGFYLIDETGAIAVRMDSSELAKLEFGYEVIVTGTRTVTKDGGGQICIDNGFIATNNYGSHSYSTASFISGKTVTDITKLSDFASATTDIYIVTGEVVKVEKQYSSTIYISDGTAELLLYTSNASQYSWLTEYIGQELTIEINTCDWNAKGLKGCVLSVILADGTKVYNLVNFG